MLDGGATTVGIESTVLDISTAEPVVLRPGAVTVEMLRELLPHVRAMAGEDSPDAGSPMRSPGLLLRHYSPRAPLTLYEGDHAPVVERLTADAGRARARGERVGTLAADDDPIEGEDVIRLGPAADADAIASRLYASLRELDARGVDRILVRAFGGRGGLATALQDRLRRAAAGRIVRC